MNILPMKQALRKSVRGRFNFLIPTLVFSIGTAAMIFIGVGDLINRMPLNWWFFGYAGIMMIAIACITAYS
jgi:hypothetical protein